MRAICLLLFGGVLLGCHSASGRLYDQAPPVTAQAAAPSPGAEQPPTNARAPEPSAEAWAPSYSGLPATARSWPTPAQTDDLIASVGEQLADPLAARVEALERKVASLELSLQSRTASAEPEPSPSPSLAWLTPALGLLTLLAIAAAIAAIARARRTRAEVTRLQTASKLLANDTVAKHDELGPSLRRILETGA